MEAPEPIEQIDVDLNDVVDPGGDDTNASADIHGLPELPLRDDTNTDSMTEPERDGDFNSRDSLRRNFDKFAYADVDFLNSQMDSAMIDGGGLTREEEEVEQWGYYDEDEGQELEAALDESVEKFMRDMHELDSHKRAKPSEIHFFEDDVMEEGSDSSIKNTPTRSALYDALHTLKTKPTSSIPYLTNEDRQEGLMNIQDTIRKSMSPSSDDTDSEMTWPHTPMTEADEVIRDYLPGLFDSEDVPEPTEPVTVDMVNRTLHKYPLVIMDNNLDDLVKDEGCVRKFNYYEESPVVLESENPMMAKFQEILKEHLLRQVSKIKDQITQIDTDTKRLLDESKQRADAVCREEKFVRKQREDIEAYRANIEQMSSRRDAFEKELRDVREAHRRLKQEHANMKRLDEALIKEREMLNDLLQKMRSYEAEKDQNLKTSQAVSKNQEIEKRKLAQEKMKQDMLIWRLEKEIIRLSNEIERSASNCFDMRDETSCLEKLLKKVEEDSLGLEAENKLLQSTIVKMYGAIKDCDTRKLAAQQTLEVRINNYNLIVKNKIYWKNQLKKEYMELENLETQKNDLLAHLDLQRNKLIRVDRMMQQMEREVEKKHMALTLAEEERNKLDKEEVCLTKFKHNLDQEVDNKVNEMERLKRALNELLVEKQMTEKGIGHLQNEIKKLGDLNRQTEERIVDSELALAKALLDVERARSALLRTKSDYDRTHKDRKELEQEMRETTALQKRLKGKLSLLNAKHQTLEKRLAAKNKADPQNAVDINASAASWAETKMKRMQDALKLVTELTKKLSDGWFNLQNVIMKRKDDRARQIHQLNIKRKHCHTMDSCRTRIDRNLNHVQQTINKSNKEIKKEQRLFERWQGEKAKACEKLERLTSVTTELESKFVDDVAESEKDAKLIENDIDRLRSDIEDLSKETARLQADLLEAEKRKDLAEIAKSKIERFQAPSGELGQLKQEIHRMEVRYAHLKKAQEKLLVDLEQCITRRDRMLDNAEAREVRSQATGKQWSRMQVQRKMDDLKNKIQSLKRKNALMNKEQLELSYQLAEAREEYNNIKGGIETLKTSLEELERQMEEGQLHKHACLETTLYRQKKAKLLEDFKFGRYKCAFKTPGALSAEEDKQTRLKNTLRTVLENLLNDFPQLGLQIAQIDNTLQPVMPDRRDSDNGEDKRLSPDTASTQAILDRETMLIGTHVRENDQCADSPRGPRRLPKGPTFPLKPVNWTSLDIAK